MVERGIYGRLGVMPPKAQDNSAGAIAAIARHIAQKGSRALIVGGSVRDGFLGRPSRDQDVEVLGCTLDQLVESLAEFGQPIRMGQSFESLRLPGLDIDFSVAESPDLDFSEAARRRDLSINSMGMDPLTGEILDPHNGRRDLAQRVLRATDPTRFGDDPLRALRVARMTAELEMEPDEELIALSAQQDLSTVARERIFHEFRKVLLRAAAPSTALRILEKTEQLAPFPQLDALRGVPQDPRWHPEGDVWVHTLMVVDEAAALRRGDDDDLALMFGALCHDMGKPKRTQHLGDKISARGHEARGIEAAVDFLEAMRAPARLVRKVAGLVEHHLAPALYPRGSAGPRGYRRLARRLEAAQLSMELLARLARADHLGRTTEEALGRVFPDGDRFLEAAQALGVAENAEPDIVQGRHLMKRGIPPGPEFAQLLERCRTYQEETGEQDPERILDRVL